MGQPGVRVVRPGAGRTLKILGDEVISIVTGPDTGGAYSLGQQVSQPGSGPPLHRHSREDEGFYVLEGEYEFHVGDQTIPAGPGTFLFAPRGIPHTFRCVGSHPGRIQVTITPAGLEKFFEEVSLLASSGPPDMGTVTAVAGKYGLEILGPPPGA